MKPRFALPLLLLASGLLLLAAVEAFQMPSPVAEAKVLREWIGELEKKKRKEEEQRSDGAIKIDRKFSFPFSRCSLPAFPNSNPLFRQSKSL